MSVNNSPLSKRNQKMSTNVNHLLNFTLPPRQARPITSVPRRSRKTGPVQGVWNKERFVNAQYRFVMNPHGDYTVHFADPDIFFQWQDVLQVIIPRSSALAAAAASGELSSQEEGFTNCPICLSPPTVPRMTKCGHVFCLPCILHYLSNSENSWARCPICFDSINERQLKSVKWYDGPRMTSVDPASLPGDKEGTLVAGSSSSSSAPESTFDPVVPQAGSSITMRLIQRPQITTLALPRSPTWPSDLLPPHQAPFHFLPDVFNFAKFMLATPAYLIEDLTRDLDDLEGERRTLTSLNDSLGLVFVDGAEHSIREEIAKAVALETTSLKYQVHRAQRDQQDIEERVARDAARRRAEENAAAAATPTSSPQEIPHELLAVRVGGITLDNQDRTPPTSRPPSQTRNAPRQRRNLNPPPPSTSTYYYYQAASGLPLFLHPLDIKILLSHFNSYASFPDTITIRVESVAEGTVNDDLRKRCKYLAHMPEGADVVFIEADLRGVVGTEGLKNFEGPLKMRTSRRKEKSRKDDRAKARAEERERERLTAEALSWTRHGSSSEQYHEEPHRHHHTYDDIAIPDDFPVAPPPASGTTPPMAVSSSPTGAWGNRSFASALHSASPGPRRPGVGQAQSRTQHTLEDEYDLDVAWHELEQRSGNGSGGRRKRANKLVVLGSGGAGARRR